MVVVGDMNDGSNVEHSHRESTLASMEVENRAACIKRKRRRNRGLASKVMKSG